MGNQQGTHGRVAVGGTRNGQDRYGDGYANDGDPYGDGAPRSAAPIIADVAFIAAIAALVASGVALAHAIRPTILLQIPIGPSLLGPLAVVAGAAFVIGIVARVMASRNRRFGGRGRGAKRAASAIGSAILALVLCAAGFGVNTLFPDGIIKDLPPDNAPIDDAAAMKADVEAAAGVCAEGWKSIDTSSYPGVETAQACKSTLTAYATFDEGMLNFYRTPISNKSKELLDTYANGVTPRAGWGELYGQRWIVVSGNDQLDKLKEKWGGTQETLG